MKKTFLFIAFNICVVLGVHAQEISNSIKVNPLALWDGSDLLSYERGITKHSSVLFGAGIGRFRVGGLKYKSQGASLQYRYYFTESINKFYLGALAHYQGGEVIPGEEETIEFALAFFTINRPIYFHSLGGGIKSGYQLANKGGLTLDLNLGISYMPFNYKDHGTITVKLKENGIIPTFGFGLGYSW
ncbi:DUF3575 domain-containing protein [Aquimarina mytili]|uniref:DUF3575 domain-containing protein n=1 Tax=Aquimarina mytili TaxID=874423 RepID=A0A936ZUZ0_9FLAO|nr:DUF3575 domain-containing protein [Aquimarina mytili]MBL0682656.1 DUF3575 domain-containing protein [Aquimarina mytili]